MTRHPDSPVPSEQMLACTLWKCHQNATQGPGDGSVTWWTIQPIEREWWIRTADHFLDTLTANPGLLPAPEVSRGVAEAVECDCGHGYHLHDPDAVPSLCLTCGDDAQCGTAVHDLMMLALHGHPSDLEEALRDLLAPEVLPCPKNHAGPCFEGRPDLCANILTNERAAAALPADDGADCCRERTTAGGCGCGSVEGGGGA